jgi:hypothetical protein
VPESNQIDPRAFALRVGALESTNAFSSVRGGHYRVRCVAETPMLSQQMANGSDHL